jgi:hypothetical protein
MQICWVYKRVGCVRREQALELLRRGWPAGDDPRYDPNHALMLCRMMSFRPGLTFLYENLRLFREVLQVSTTPAPLWQLILHSFLGGFFLADTPA